MKRILSTLVCFVMVSWCFCQPMTKNTVRLKHDQYVTIYDTIRRCPRKVTWTIYPVNFKSSKHSRKFCRFQEDPLVPWCSNTSPDYTKSGYDRGHMCPAGDAAWNVRYLDQTFYMTNIAPQTPGLNRRTWKKLESQTREVIMTSDSIVIVAGTLFKGPQKYIKTVQVPSQFFKVLYIFKGGSHRTLAWVFENDSKGTQREVTILDLRKLLK